MAFDVNNILLKYEKSVIIKDEETKYLHYPSESDTLIVCFTTLGPHIYERVRMFWEESEVWKYNFLFISDNNGKHSGQYYLGAYPKREIETITSTIIDKIVRGNGIKNIITIGSSMGGYAAIYYAIKYNFLGALSVVPQVNESIINEFGWLKWKETVNEIGGLPSLITMINEADSLPNIFFQNGTYKADEVAGELIFEHLNKKNGFFIHDKFDKNDHTSDFLSKELSFSIFEVFLSIVRTRDKGGIH
ncbi:hypothetical protein [Rossellomorea vietnamensis]|uniref:hypothetical protein n=1 Tax=Rossellomorea vietnamensis TaxID=218284 RepID=UPI000556749F|nr:hypothetical protein [Rossellomorea vietnamensis]